MSDLARRVPGSRRACAWTSGICITVSLLAMLAVSAAGPSIVVPGMAHTSGAPPWWGQSHVPNWILFVMWGVAVVAATGVAAGLIAVARGARPPVRALLAVSFIAVAAFCVLPPAGSTDAQSYALDGSMVVMGHSPYVDTPAQMARHGDPFAINSPQTWQNAKSDYGPLATGEEWLSAEFGGWSMAQVTFWLKLWVAIAFVAVTLLLDRVLRSGDGDEARRLRAHLLWSVNPLVLWEIVAAGHVDALAVVFGFAGVLLISQRPSLLRTAAAGALIGLAGDVKVPLLVYGLGAAWAVRRSVSRLAVLAAGALVVLVPAYAAFGPASVAVLAGRGSGVTWDNLYQVFYRAMGMSPFGADNVPSAVPKIALAAFVVVAVIAFLRLPDRVPELPAVTPALALSVAWLFLFPFQRPWYDVMALVLLALYPRSWLDWVVLVRLCFGAITYMESGLVDHRVLLERIQLFQGEFITSSVRLLAVAALLWMCATQRWGFDEPVDNLLQPVRNPVDSSC